MRDGLFDPEAFRALGERVLDLVTRHLGDESRDPALPHVRGAELRALLDEPLPRSACSEEEWLAAIDARLLPHGRRNAHPRFFGYVQSSADPIGVLADTVTSAWNQNVTAWRSAPAAAEVERLVLRWLDELVGFSGTGDGLLTSGGSAANFTAIAAAITAAERTGDSTTVARSQCTVYRSTEGHLSIAKAVRVLGATLRTVAVDAKRCLSAPQLARVLDEDRARGLVPACVCATAGTANTGAIDPLEEIAAICRERRVWLHVDGAYGAPAAMAPSHAGLRSGLAAANSCTLDPHKWLFAPLDTGCLLVRDAKALTRAFALDSEYTRVEQQDPIEAHAFFDHGLELSRRARAVKIWSILKLRGVDAIATTIENQITLRRELDARVEHEPRLEALGSGLSIACFRYLPPRSAGLQEANQLNQQIVHSLVEEGHAFLSPTELDGRTALRVCILSMRTRSDDLTFLVDEILRLGAALEAA